jgi:hypothetical protein
MKLTSPEFSEGSSIPVRYTQEGDDISPPLEWSEVPEDTKSFALICEDLDAPKKSKGGPNFTHWVIYNIGPNVTSIPEGLPDSAHIHIPILASQGENSFGDIGYGGPMPPVGSGAHHYVFTLYACRKVLEVPPGTEKNQLMQALKGNVIETAQLTGLYERLKQNRTQKETSLRT